MSIFGPRTPERVSIFTFADVKPVKAPRAASSGHPAVPPALPAPPVAPVPMLTPDPTLFDRLLKAALAAELAQVALESARRRCEEGPTEERRRAFLREAANALEKEVAFDEIWESASIAWFHV